ncbi:hypothetical protein MI170_24095 [Mycolicibacterium goodii]|uniref:Uncharacterized protein n=1 Tax=Mycolicibacterium goodii TaxID=134601 RepID=A0ABS6HKZ0_MYCGD|nr:hypothetical protein [Mycolicibacterium goodii]MBU8823363.1 hypothetical protein [Mycolicibacterium goodii]ULN46347.1 hypothetical protein MI170_24095 [Mycolicibacterium goodii]
MAARTTLLRTTDIQAFGRVHLTLNGRFLALLTGMAPLGLRRQTAQAFLFTLGCRALTLVGESLTPVGLEFALVGDPVPLVCELVSFVGEPLATLQFGLSTLQREVALVSSDISVVGLARRVSAALDVHDSSSINGRS